MLSMPANIGFVHLDARPITPQIGPCPCPQEGCQEGYVVFEVCYDTGLGYLKPEDYIARNVCRCCDGKGYLMEGERAYESYFLSEQDPKFIAPYPNPVSLSSEVYDDFFKKKKNSK